MSNLFHVIEASAVVLHSRGVFKQVKAYRRGKDVYAQHGGGFIKLGQKINAGNMRGDTSHPEVKWEEIEAEGVTLDKGKYPTFSELA